jgi:ribosome maturation factor RimP
MAHDISTLQELLAPSVAALGYELLGCIYISQGRHTVLRIYIDSANGISVADCERVSRQLSAVLDVEDPIAGTYSLEVSSPGIDRPLFTREQFLRFLGAQVNIKLHAPLEDRRHFKGRLINVVDANVIVNVDGKEFALPLANIAKANLVAEI